MTGRQVEMKESGVIGEMSVLPACRIQCEPGCIKIGDKEYRSASEALNAYLDQFDTPDTNSRFLFRPNNSLETSVLKIQQHKIINDEIQKAKQDIKIEVLKKSLDKSKKREQGYLQKEVDDALAKSGELLDRLNTTDDSIQQCPSDLGSLTTDILLTVNPYQNLKRSESKHVYSYHRTSRLPTPFISTSQSTNQNNSDGYKSKLPPTGLGANKSKSNTASVKNGRAVRSRSVSPTSGKSFKTPTWVQELDNSNTNGPPSWIDGLAASDISDSIWNDKNRINQQDDKLRTLPEETSTYLNSTVPGLNYSDLHSKTTDNKTQSFSELRKYTANIISKADKFLKENELGLNGSKSLDTDMSSIHQHSELTPKRKGLHTTLDKYIADMSSPFSGKKDSESIENMPRCSSMDNMMGGDAGPKSDITGASTIPMTSNPVTPKKSGKPTVTFSPYHLGKSPNSSAILDGDRPWENPPLLKEPVYIDRKSPVPIETSNKISKSPTLSGGQQPGSLEALKKMLFKLQAESNTDSYLSQNDVNPAEKLDMPALKDYNFESEPGGHSLEKALVHLSRLKSLVEKKDSYIQESVLDKSYHSAPSSPRR